MISSFFECTPAVAANLIIIGDSRGGSQVSVRSILSTKLEPQRFSADTSLVAGPQLLLEANQFKNPTVTEPY